MTKILIIEARFYPEISDGLLRGAKTVLEKAGAEFDVITISGALEIPAVIAMKAKNYAGFVALGCVIRGETYHFDIVANESARGIMELTLEGIAIGNGIITTEDEAQAIARAGEIGNSMNKGEFAAKACLELIKIKEAL
jgi:6,7-dimethyl-8-ribityllumazine synthase